MNHLAVGIFHDDSIARELGKKDTESDILMHNRKTDDHIITFMQPLEDRLLVKSQIISSIDAAIITFTKMTRELGETIVMLDSLGISRGVAVTTSYSTPAQIGAITKGTSLESFVVEKNDPVKLLAFLKGLNPERDADSPAQVVVDHSFSVKGVGEVVLGFVKRGIIRKYDKLTLLPSGKEVTVRSIQIQDEDCDSAETGSRIGLAIKGATVDEIKRGSILSGADNIKVDTKIRLDFKKSIFSDSIEAGDFHVAVGMQTSPTTIIEKSESAIAMEVKKPIAYTTDDTFFLLDLNAKKTRIMGTGHATREGYSG